MNIEIANRLLKCRKKKGLSQEEFAEKIGVSRQAVSKWERAEASPDTDNLIAIAEVYGLSLDELLRGSESVVHEEKENAFGDFSAADNNNCEQGCNYSSACGENGAEGTKYQKYDKVSFKNGIHVHSKDGDHVDISIKDGIKVNDRHGNKVKVGFDGIHVEENGEQKVYTDEEGHVFYSEDIKENKKAKSAWYKFPFPVVAVLAFFIWGVSGWCGGWSLSWIVFLTVPLYYTTVDAVVKGKPSHFAFPVLVVIVYLLFGFLMNLWHPMWIIFLTIPIYYFICELISDVVDKHKEAKKTVDVNAEQTE